MRQRYSLLKANKHVVRLSGSIYIAGLMIGWVLNTIFRPKNLPSVGANIWGVSHTSMAGTGFMEILVKNFSVLITEILGSLTFSITTFWVLVSNGMALGSVVPEAIQNSNPQTVFLGLFPHGIIEIPGIILAGAAGFKIPYEILRYLVGRKDYILNKQELKDYLYLSLISIILIIIAAWIEANVTMRIAKSLS